MEADLYRKTMSLRASPQTGVAISWIFEYFRPKIETLPFYLGDRHTSL